jgi:hypothetical protein
MMIRDVSVSIATLVAEVAYGGSLPKGTGSNHLPGFIRSQTYEFAYRACV